MIYNNIIEMIGNTPLIKLNKINPYKNVNIYAKLEGLNPGGSIKDRIALEMINNAINEKKLTKDKTIIEPTSGNTGIGIAMVGAVLGYNVEIVMSEAVSIERRKVLEALGAKIILSPKDEGTDGAIKLCKYLVKKHPEKYFMPDQFNNKNNYLAHYKTTANEIIKDLPNIDMFICALGTSGTIIGCSKKLKEYNKKIKTIAVEPTIGHKIQGLKNMNEAIVPGIYDENLYDEKITVIDEDAYNYARQIMKIEGIFVGMSSGAALFGALKKAKEFNKGCKDKELNIVIIFPDRAEKYLSTKLIEGDKMSFKLFNTLTRKKQEFITLEKNKVKMYTCGPTVYNYAHIGNFRSYIFSDLLKRYLLFKGYEVIHVMNITDVDDKTIKGSINENKTLTEFTNFYTNEFFKDFKSLNILKPEFIPKATDTINEMVEFVKKLLDKGYAYKSEDGSIYFDISKFKKYGEMANINLNNLKKGARICHDNYEKENASDFVLWKAYKKEEDKDVFWETEIGKGRPGWHLECSTMSMKYLGECIDIHTGGIDLVFPHHQNEVAQSEALTKKTFVNYWIHCNHLIVDGKKMSKSLGNFYTIRDLLKKGFSEKAIRYLLISTHYRQQLNLTIKSLNAAENTINRLNEFILRLNDIENNNKNNNKGIDILINELNEHFIKAMDDDLNTPEAIASLFEFIKKINKLIDENRISKENANKIKDELNKLDTILGILDYKEEQIPKEIIDLAEERLIARNEKNWELSDKLREKIEQKGYSIKDIKNNYRIIKKNN
ncbi:MAG: cysteine--tRNA ligase [Candidatus Woesearchaeota archaeon]